MKHDKVQLNELFHNYGEIDLLFMAFAENPSQELLDYCWDMEPNLVITRGAMHTPEEFIPSQNIPGPWEACMTIGTQWQYKPANEIYKDGTELIQMLIEARA